MDKFTRQLNLIALLEQAGSPLTFAEIRSRLRDEAYPQRDPESARRAFERDKADLLAMGVPLESVATPEDPSITAYRIGSKRSSGGHAARLGDPGFSPSELAALRFAATAVALRSGSVHDVGDATDGLRKYGGLDTPGAQRTVADLRLDDNVGELFAAILDSAAVGFTYSGRTRRVVPVQLANRSGHWYLRSEDLDAGCSRTYRLDRFESPVLRLPPDDADQSDDELDPDVATTRSRRTQGALRIRPWEFGSAEPVRALVALDAAAAAVATAGDPDLEILESSAEGSTIALAVSNPEGLWPWLLAFLDRAELLEPADLREEYRRHLLSIVSTS